MSHFNILTVREMIDATFDENNSYCPVNFNMLGSVLFIIARRMELLKRRFKIEMEERRTRKNIQLNGFMATEIKIHTMGKRKKRRALGDKLMTSEYLPSDKKHRAEKRSGSLSHKTSGQYISDDNSSEISTSDDRFIEESATHKRSDDKYIQKKRPIKTHRSERLTSLNYSDKTSPFQRRRGRNERRGDRKYSDDSSLAVSRTKDKRKSPARHRKADRYSDEVSSSHQRRSEMFPAERRKAGKYSDEGSPSYRRRSGKYSDEESPSYRRKSGKYSDEESPSYRRKSGKYSDEESPSYRRKSGKYSNDISPAERRRAGKRDEMSPSDRNRAGHYDSSPDESSAISRKSRPGKRVDQKGKIDTDGRLQSYSGKLKGEESNDRKNNYDNRDKRHQQASNDDDLEPRYEKILVVTRTPSGREIKRPALSPVATEEQYNSLLAKIRQLQQKFNITTNWNDLTKITSMTDPKAALNISVRLDRAENRLAKIMETVTKVAIQVPGVDVEAILNEASLPETASITFKTASVESGRHSDQLVRVLGVDINPTYGGYSTIVHDKADDATESTITKSYVTPIELDDEFKTLRDSLKREINEAFAKTGIEKCCQKFEKPVRQVIEAGIQSQQVAGLHYTIDKLNNVVTSIDERMTSQMAIFQDSLLNMQGELESALEKVIESILSPKEDPIAVAQITETFKGYNSDLVQTDVIQKKLKQRYGKFSEDLNINKKRFAELISSRLEIIYLPACGPKDMSSEFAPFQENIERRIEMVRNHKCTREQMFEALKNKLSLKDVNGIISQDQFTAVIASGQDNLKKLSFKMFSKEYDWQVIIENFASKCNQCADINQTKSLQASMQRYFVGMDNYLEEMFAITMPHTKYTTDKKIIRDEKCLSCGASPEVVPNKLNLELWQEIASDIQPIQYKYEEMTTCIPGLPIPHPLEQDSYICMHDCGELVNEEMVLELFGKKLDPNSQAGRDDKPQEGDI